MIEYPNNRTLNESGSGGCGDVNVPGPVGCRAKTDWLAAFGNNLVEVGSRILHVHSKLPAGVWPLGVAERRDIDAADESTNRAAQTVC